MAPGLRWLAVTVPLTLAALTVACGGSSGASGDPTAAPTVTITFSPTIPPSTPTAAPPGPGPVVFLAQTEKGLAAHTVDAPGPELAAAVANNGFPLAARAVLSPDGARVAWAPADVAAADIFVANADGSARTNITRTDDDDEEPPLWSPEGGRLAFLVRTDGAKPFTALRVIGAVTGAPLATLPAPPDGFEALAWLPDGNGFSFLAPGNDGNLDLFALSFDDTVHQLTRSPDAELAAAWSPAMDRVAFVRLPAATPTPTVTPTEEALTDTPDDAATSTEPVSDGTPLPSETPTPGEAPATPAQPSPSPTAPPAPPGSQLWLLDLSGGEIRLWAPGLSGFSGLRWSPDGRYLSFLARSATGGEALYLVEVAAFTEPDLVFARSRVDEWTWAPDSSALAIVANGGECGRTCPRGFLHILDLTTGALRTLPDIRVLSPIAWPWE